MRNDKPRQWTEAEIRLLVKMTSQGARPAEIASVLERYLASVRRVARDLGLVLRG